MRVIIAGGGTGGHVFPGLAIADELKKRDIMTEVIFAGTEHGIEARVIPKEGYQIKFLRAEGIVGVSLLKKARAVFKIVLSVLDSFRIMKAVKPDIVIGVGGYASGALVLTAFFLSVPTMILEQNSIPGFTNKTLGKLVSVVCITYQESISFFPRTKTFLTGNPIRELILRGDPGSARRLFSLEKGLFTIFAFGGSAGAKSINIALVDALNYLFDLKEKIQFLHQTGPRDYEITREAYRKAGFKGTITPFVYQMGEAYAVADIVISRAGATTLAELTALGKPAILIPFPFAAGQHQEANAQKLVQMGAARIVLDHEMKGETLAGIIRDLYMNSPAREEMQRNSQAVGRPEACGKVVNIAMSLIKQASAKGLKRKNTGNV